MPEPQQVRDGLFQRLAGLHPALLLLAGSAARVRAHDGQRIGRTWLVLGLAGLSWGLVLAGIWSLAGSWFRWHQGLPLAHTIAVLLAMGLGPFRRSLIALASVLDDESPVAQATMSALLLLVLALALVQIVPLQEERAHWLRPDPPLRVLILMPMWGAWAMMVPGHFCRPSAGACPLVRGFIEHQPVAATALWMALPLAGTLWWLNFLDNWVATAAPALAALAGGAGGVALCRLRGGIGRTALLAANMLTQLAFFLAYLTAKAS